VLHDGIIILLYFLATEFLGSVRATYLTRERGREMVNYSITFFEALTRQVGISGEINSHREKQHQLTRAKHNS
jgi:hypothetical protein